MRKSRELPQSLRVTLGVWRDSEGSKMDKNGDGGNCEL